MQLCAYHGTPKKNVKSIETNGLYMSTGQKQWFGDGCYFFETAYMSDGFEEAKNWVINVKHTAQWAVFQADIESKHFIDLVDCELHKSYYCKIREALHKKHKKSGKSHNYFFEQMIYRLLRENMTADFIRAIVNSDNYGKYNYCSYTVLRPQVQVCAIKKECIKDIRFYKGM